jgi:hypothetical protein
LEFNMSTPPTPTTPPDRGHWKDWDGYDGPVPRDTLVDLKCADGSVYINQLAVDWWWCHHDQREATNIVAWRRHDPTPLYGDSPGYRLAMRVLLSPMYSQLHADERADCDELIRLGQESQ